MKAYFELARPSQWIKNLFLFAGLIFAVEFTNPESIGYALMAFVAFCLASSGVYAVNDMLDAEFDRAHPAKRYRPIARGTISIRAASIYAGVLLGVALVIGFYINQLFLGVLLLYSALSIVYSLFLKHYAIVDVFTIAFGFVLRAIAGAIAINVVFSPWLILTTFFLTLFLAITKRRQEIRLSTQKTRPVLAQYSLPLLDQMQAIVAPVIVVVYTLYTFASGHTPLFIITVPIVLYGIFHYIYMLERKTELDDGPVSDIFLDWGLIVAIFLWVLVSAVLLTFELYA